MSRSDINERAKAEASRLYDFAGWRDFTKFDFRAAFVAGARFAASLPEAHQTTQSQDLRKRAESLLVACQPDPFNHTGEDDILLYYEDAVNAMLQFASEVSGEKDRMIAELDKQVDLLQKVIADVKNENFKAALSKADDIIEEKNKRIAELEAEVKDLSECNDNVERNYHIEAGRAKELEAEVKRLKDTRPMQLCPKCNGQGIVDKPSYVPGDVYQWVSSAATHVCDVCNGAKLI